MTEHKENIYINKMVKSIIFVAVLLLPQFAFAKDYSLQDCIDIALKNDPNIVVSESMKSVQKARVGQQKSDYFPKLTAGTGFYHQNNNMTMNNNYGNMGGMNSNNYYQLNLGVNQLIWNFGKTIAKINMQKYNLESAGYDYENQVLNTTYRVKFAYFGVLAALANQDIAERTVSINQLNYDRTKALFDEGLKSKIDVVNAEVYLTDAKIQLLDAQNKYLISMITLNNAMYNTDKTHYGVKNTENFNFTRLKPVKNEINVNTVKKQNSNELEYTAVLTSGIEKQDILQDYKFLPMLVTEEDAIKKAYENRPDLKSLLMVKKASEESLKSIQRSYMPSLSANVGYSWRKNQDITNSGFNTSASLDFSAVNLMNVKCSIDEAKSYLKIADENINLSKKNIFFEVQTNYTNMVQLEKRIPLKAQKVKQTLENFELADGRYSVGLGNFIELQNAQLNYNNAQLDLVAAVFNYNVARETLLKSMGVK